MSAGSQLLVLVERRETGGINYFLLQPGVCIGDCEGGEEWTRTWPWRLGRPCRGEKLSLNNTEEEMGVARLVVGLCRIMASKDTLNLRSYWVANRTLLA